MLTKAEVRAAVACEPVSAVPAWLFWLDQKFEEAHQSDVERMRSLYQDDFLQPFPVLIRRAGEPADLTAGEFTDDWGCRWRAAPDGVGKHPTRGIVENVDDWARYMDQAIPQIDPQVYAGSVRDAVATAPDRYVLARLWGTFFHRMTYLAGFCKILMDIADDGELFRRMIRDLSRFQMRGIQAVADAGADGVYLADDWGTQTSLQISPAVWRRHFRPAYAEMIELAHGRGLDVWFHTDGNVIEIVPDFIDIGLDVLGNLQASALALRAVADTAAGRMTLFGGLDTAALSRVESAVIPDMVHDLYATFQPFEGGYVFSGDNSIMPDTPVENVWELFRTVRALGQR